MPDMQPMITYERAVEIIRANAVLLDAETVELLGSLNRVLRQDVLCDIDMPPFDKSAMDGYACRSEDVGNLLEVVEVIPAGHPPQHTIGRNQCAKIMTGAMLPAGADCVVIVEEVEETSNGMIRFKGTHVHPNICRRGEDVVAGQQLVSSGTRITPKEIAALALAGCTSPRVCRRPRIGIIATGDEIVEPHRVPAGTEIRNSNSYQLYAQSLRFGAQPSYYGIVPDTNEAIGRVIEKAKPESDLILLTGGVSMGDFDLVPSILKEQGFQILFEKVAIQPGKPTVFGRAGDRFVFGLPGNPVSSFTIFEVLVKELLSCMMGLTSHAQTARYTLASAVRRKNAVRLAWIPVKVTAEGLAEPVRYHGSAHITSLASADGMITLPIGVTEIEKGTFVEVRRI